MQHDEDASEQAHIPSKSQRKREATTLQALGKKLVALSDAQLAKLSLPAELEEAIRQSRNMHQHGALRRQLQYIGKLMRRLDSEPIITALAALEDGGVVARRRQQRLENLCDELLTGAPTHLEDFLTRHPEVDRQYLRQLLRNAARAQSTDKAQKTRRTLYVYLRELTAAD